MNPGHTTQTAALEEEQARQHRNSLDALKDPSTAIDGEWGQPMPIGNDSEDIQSMVVRDVESRRELGIQRYGTALQAWNGRFALKDAYEEALDLTMYLKQQLVEDEETVTFGTLWDEIGEWSNRVFGDEQARGPIGPLNHLKRECLEAIEAIEGGNHWEASVELADCLILVFDAARRYDMTPGGLLGTALDKMETNRGRVMGEPDAEGVVEHRRDLD